MPVKILIVEDEAIIAMDMECTLRKYGYLVGGTAFSSEEAIDKAKKLAPDLILMDVHIMGDEDGIETARRIKEWKEIPVVFLTAHSDPETLERAKDVLPVAFLVKPYNEWELNAVIEIGVCRHTAEEKLRGMERNQRNLNSSVASGLVVVGEDGEVLCVNRAAESLLNGSSDGVLKQLDIVNSAAPQKKRIQIENGDGKKVHLEISTVEIDWDGGRALLHTLTDISELIRTENRLKSESFKDDKTDLYTRKAFDVLAQQHMLLAKRRKSGFIVLDLKFDGLSEKQNGVFSELALVVAKSFRGSDIVAGVGTDEIAVLAVDADQNSKDIIENRLAQNIDNWKLRAASVPPFTLTTKSAYFDGSYFCPSEELIRIATQKN